MLVFEVGKVYVGKHTEGYDVYCRAVGREDDLISFERCTESGRAMDCPCSAMVDFDGDCEIAEIVLGRYTSVIVRADEPEM